MVMWTVIMEEWQPRKWMKRLDGFSFVLVHSAALFVMPCTKQDFTVEPPQLQDKLIEKNCFIVFPGNG